MINSNIGSVIARVALLVFWGAGFGTLIVLWAGELGAAEVCAGLLLLAAAFALTTPRPDPLPQPSAIAVLVLVSFAVTILTIETVAADQGGRTLAWAVEYSSYLGGLAAVRGRRLLGACTVLVSVALLLTTWALAERAEVTLGTLVPSIGALAVALAWGTVLPRGHRIIAGLRGELERGQQIEVVARATAVEQDARITEAVALAAPQLRAIASGRDLSAEELAEVRATEGDIRDTLTAPWLDAPAVRDAIHGARKRGVDVSVIDLRDATEEVPAGLTANAVTVLADVLNGADSGRIAVRLGSGSADAPSIGSVVVVQQDGIVRHQIPVE